MKLFASKFYQTLVLNVATIRHCYSITQIVFSIIAGVRCNDNVLGNYLRKLVSDRVGSVSIRTPKTNKITLIDRLCDRQTIKASMKNNCNLTRVVLINFLMRMIDFDFNFVKDTFSADEELTRRRIGAKDYSRSTINLNTEMTRIDEPI